MRVAIIGGGVIGSGIAWRLAQRGVDIVVIDDQTRPGAASRAAGGMLAPLAEAHRAGPFLDLGVESLRRYPTFVAELEAATGLAVGYARAGKLVAALSAGEVDDLQSTFSWWQNASSATTEWLDGAQARRLEPAMSQDVRAAVLIRDDHRVDNVLLAAALSRAVSVAGGRTIAARATRVIERGGRVAGVEARGDMIDADVVVVSAGAWSGAIEGLPRELPVRPVRGQMLALKPARSAFGRTLASTEAYLVPRPDGRIIVGSTMEEAGFDAAYTPDALALLRAAAVRVVPELGEAARVGAWAGLRPATPDGLPVLGADARLPGLFYATGHFRNGILLAPVTADALAAAILGGSDFDLAAYSPARFEASGDRHQASETATRSASDSSAPEPSTELVCDLCGSPMYEVHCKVICRTCGYKRDCSDLW